MTFPEYLDSRLDHVIDLTIEHAGVTLLSLAIATVIAVGVGIAVHRRERAADLAIAIASVVLTIPSFALYGLLIAPLGLGYPPTVVALVFYALLPILRNTVTGLRGIDRAVLESARAMGMSARRRLLRVELPLAWPTILAGIRVSAVLSLGIATIAAAINGPGLGVLIFEGIGRIGAVNAVNQTVTGILGVVVLALLFDVAFYAVRRLTISRGVRA